MYCKNCGTEIPDNSRFCPNCGAPQSVKQAAKPAKPKKKRHPILTFFLILIVAAVFFNMANSSSESNTEAKTEKVTKETPAPTEKPTPTPTPAPTKEPVNLKLGKSAEIDGLEFTVKKMVISKYAGALNGLNEADSDYTYLVVYVDVKNPTNEEKKLRTKLLLGTGWSNYDFDLFYDGEVEYNRSFAEYTDFLDANESILPRATLRNKVLKYKVPVEVQKSKKPIIIRLSPHSSGSDEVYIWKLR